MYRETGVLSGELPEESDQFRFSRTPRLTSLKGSVGLIVDKVSVMRVTITIEWHMVYVHFENFIGFTVYHSSNVTFFLFYCFNNIIR